MICPPFSFLGPYLALPRPIQEKGDAWETIGLRILYSAFTRKASKLLLFVFYFYFIKVFFVEKIQNNSFTRGFVIVPHNRLKYL